MKVAQNVNKDSKRSETDSGKSSWQNQLAQTTYSGYSELALKQKALVEDINASPRMLAQRKLIESYLSPDKPSDSPNSSALAHPQLPIQAKLTIGQPDDQYEQEADLVAARVVAKINTQPPENLLQEQPQPGKTFAGQKLQTKTAPPSHEAVQGGEATSSLESSINRAKGGGQPLDEELLQTVGPMMGMDFSGVRVHTDTTADQLNRSIYANAFTTGQDVFFRQGEYNPRSRKGQELIVHELTHVLQQTGSKLQINQNQPVPEQNPHESIGNDGLNLKGFSPADAGMIQSQCTACKKEEESKDEKKQVIQPKLAIAQPADRYEQEADRVAGEVVNQIQKPEQKTPNLARIERNDLTLDPDSSPTLKTRNNSHDLATQEKPVTHDPVSSTFSSLAHSSLPFPLIQREVSFTLKNKGEPDFMANKIVHANTGERVDFIEKRIEAHQCAEDEDRRHIIGYDLIARALRKLVKNLTVKETYDWLKKADSWVDQTHAVADLAAVQQTLPGVEQGLTQWLRNANSDASNLFCGSSRINRRKGATVPHMARLVKRQWNTSELKYIKVNSIKAVDKRSKQESLFIYDGRFYRKALIFDRNTRQPSGASVTTIPTAIVMIDLQDEHNQQKTLQGGAFLFKELMALGFSTQAPKTVQQVSREHVLPELGAHTANLDLEGARQGFLANEVDIDESKNYTQSYDTTIANSIEVKVPKGNSQKIANIGMTEKYTPKGMPKPDYHKAKDKAQRSLNPSQSRFPISVPRLKAKGDRPHHDPHAPVFVFREPQGQIQFRKEPNTFVSPLIQRKVSLTLEDQRADVMSQPIVGINPGARPPLIDQRVRPCPEGQDRRHKVGYDLIATSLKGLLKYRTPNQVADWLDDTSNWLGKSFIDNDRKPLDNGKVHRTLGAVESMTGQWLINAQNNPDNFFCGNEDINRRKGAAIAGFKSGVKQNWVGPSWPLNDIDLIQGENNITNKSVNIKYGNESKGHVSGDVLRKEATGGKMLVSLPGTVLSILLKDRSEHKWGAAVIFQGTDNIWRIYRVSRSFDPKVFSLGELEQARQGYVANEIDTREPNLTQPHATYGESYEAYFSQFAVLDPLFVPLVSTVLFSTNEKLKQDYDQKMIEYRPTSRTEKNMGGHGSPYARPGQPSRVGPIKGHQPLPQVLPPVEPLMLNIPMLALILEKENRSEGYSKIIQEHMKEQSYFTILATVETTIQQLQNKGINPSQYSGCSIYQGVANWALSRSDHKYRPKNPIAPDYHKTQDEYSTEITNARERLQQWRAKKLKNTEAKLITRTLDIVDLEVLFNRYSFSKSTSDLEWIKKALRGKKRGIDWLTFSNAVDKANSIQSDKKDIKKAFEEALKANWIMFPTGW